MKEKIDREYAQKRKIERKKEEKRNREFERRRSESFSSKKKVGDKVCRDYSGLLVFNGAIEGYIERVNNNKIQIRISDRDGYMGSDYQERTLVWDHYNDWRRCSF